MGNFLLIISCLHYKKVAIPSAIIRVKHALGFLSGCDCQRHFGGLIK